MGVAALQNRSREIIDSISTSLALPPDQAFAPINKIGGKNGWYFADRLWSIRAKLDSWLGGVGMRKGRPPAEELQSGDTIDFWRVESFQPNRRLRLIAEMKLPGTAWLEFEVTSSLGGSQLRQTSIFQPAGVLGWIYWYSMLPAHLIVFRGIFYGICRAAYQEAKLDSS